MVRRLAAIMFTDVVGFTASTQLNEADALSRLREQQSLLRPLFGAYGGREVKSTGDGFLVEFESALKATECAIEVQRKIRDRNLRQAGAPIEVRIGIHVGDVEEEGGDIFGDAVNVASRIVPLAEPGGVCLSVQVVDQVRNKFVGELEPLGSRKLKGVRDPLAVYRVVLSRTGGATTERVAGVPRIAVLPLANISPDPKDEYFADGLTEELITVLSAIKGLRVISRTSVNQYRGTAKPIVQIGSELGVDSVLEGSVRKAGDQLRITVQLIDTQTDEHRWAQTYDRRLENVFAIQAEVAERTASALKVELLKSERAAIEERPTRNLRAYESYLRGIEAFRGHRGWASGRDYDEGTIRYFEAAIREDPQFSAAYAYLANYLLAVMGISRSAKETVPRVRELVAKALELNPDSCDAHTALGNLAFQADLDWARAEEEFRNAIALNPSSSSAHFWYAYLLGALQRNDEARQEYQRAIELDPLWAVPRGNLIGTYFNEGDLDTAIALCEKTLESFPISGFQLQLATLYAQAGRKSDALKMVESAGKDSDLLSRSGRAGAFAMLGWLDETRQLMTDWEEGRVPEYVPKAAAATGYATIGNYAKALDLLEADYREGDRLIWNFYQTPSFDPIRDDPRFVSMLRKANLPTNLKRGLQPPLAPSDAKG